VSISRSQVAARIGMSSHLSLELSRSHALQKLSPFLTPSNQLISILVQHINVVASNIAYQILISPFHCTPSPSSQSSTDRARLPSVDITSIYFRLTSCWSLNPSNNCSCLIEPSRERQGCPLKKAQERR